MNKIYKSYKLKEDKVSMQDVMTQSELINYICKYRYEYRMTYDSNKDWYIIGTAYDHIHEQLLYNAAPIYGLTFEEMVEYYDKHYADLNDLLYTPKETNLQLGFDHNNKVYTFKNFGSIYTKGEDLPKNLLKDLTERFGKPIYKEIEKVTNSNMYESLIKHLNELLVYNGGSTKEESDGLKYYALDKKYVKLIHPKAKINQFEIKPKNTFDYANPKHVQMLLDKLPEEIIINDNYRNFSKKFSKKQFKIILEGDSNTFGNWMILEDKDIQQIIRDLGFDSMYLLEYSFSGEEWKNIAMFESLNKELRKYI